MIYALQSIEGGPVKIGTTENLTVRIAQLEAHYGHALALLATFPGGPVEERGTHARFAHLRLGRTEQFQPAADLMAFLGRPLLVGANPAAVEAMHTPGHKQFSIINLKGTEAYRDWLAAESKRTHIPAAMIVRLGLALWAEQNGGSAPPEK